VAVTRGRVQLTEGANRLRYALLPESDVGYLLLPRQTTSSLVTEVAQSLTLLTQQTALRGVILDLRIAALGGGWPLEEMLTLFADGALGEMYTTQEVLPVEIAGQDVAGSQSLPLALLIGPDTEGLPEIFAAALQSSGRAVLFGSRTSGDIENNHLVSLPDGSRVLISSTSYRTSTGFDVGLSGLEPNLAVRFDWDAVTEQVDPVRDASQVALLRMGG
jgi:carboxyl-terminal processing protease